MLVYQRVTNLVVALQKVEKLQHQWSLVCDSCTAFTARFQSGKPYLEVMEPKKMLENVGKMENDGK